MSKQSGRKLTKRDGLRREYEFDYRESRPNRFTSQLGESTIAVVLEPDVAEVFNSSRSVNRALRSVIKAAPSPKRRSRRNTKRANQRMEPTRR